jgi:NhaA family Na+:H+ antiporter
MLGVLLWSCLHLSGLHATLAGVILAIVTPTRPPANLGALLAQAEAVLKDELRDQRQGVVWHGPSEPSAAATSTASVSPAS